MVPLHFKNRETIFFFRSVNLILSNVFNSNAVNFLASFTIFERNMFAYFLSSVALENIVMLYKHINCVGKVWLSINLMLSLGALTSHCMNNSFMRVLVHYYVSQFYSSILGFIQGFPSMIGCNIGLMTSIPE